MTRSTARELALQLCYCVAEGEATAEDALAAFFDGEHYASLAGECALYDEYPNEKQMDYIARLTRLVYERREELDEAIEKYSRGWKVTRITRTGAAILRLAMCEIAYMDDIPDRAAINEAVELAKKYEEADTVAFINGVLGGYFRGEFPERSGPAPETAEE